MKTLTTRCFIFLFFAATCMLRAEAQNQALPDAAYQQMIAKRADKIVQKLNIKDSVKAARVSRLVAKQYSDLNDIYALRDDKLKEAKVQAATDKAAADITVKNAQDAATKSVDQLHPQFITALSKELTSAQITEIKDGMTYSVMPLTYNAYLDELPNLTEPQKAQIKTWLTEAREHAMDGGSSKEKHAWFGKYKGRINNYLSAAGYDMKKAGEEWQQRIKDRNAAKNDNKAGK